MSAHTEQFTKFCTTCASNPYMVIAVLVNVAILGMLVVMLLSML